MWHFKIVPTSSSAASNAPSPSLYSPSALVMLCFVRGAVLVASRGDRLRQLVVYCKPRETRGSRGPSPPRVNDINDITVA